MHGEYIACLSRVIDSGGSPPHAWGIPSGHQAASLRPRFTPTCMGNTSTRIPTKPPPPVHPHMHGEYVTSPFIAISSAVHPHMHGEYGITYLDGFVKVGSPPHAWGIRLAWHYVNSWFRFTPTCMGNTRWPGRHRRDSSVHPHMHGEYIASSAAGWRAFGSPPHAWGIRYKAMQKAKQMRFTPTCMGNT